jgi:hypothetical protein
MHQRGDWAVRLQGRFFQLDDCRLSPRPWAPVKIVCAGQSERGMQFGAEYGDYNFVALIEESGLHMTHWWRRTDSNLWSHFQRGQRFRAGIPPSSAIWRSLLVTNPIIGAVGRVARAGVQRARRRWGIQGSNRLSPAARPLRT